jgi:hypothetical protein
MPSSTIKRQSKAEARRQATLKRRQQTAAVVIDRSGAEIVPRAPQSFLAQVQKQAMPIDLVRQGRIEVSQQLQPTVALYDPALLAPNPQRARLLDERLDELAASLDAHGQQEPIIARLITETDRQRFPQSFGDRQILLILKGHRIYFARAKSKLSMLKVELMPPIEGEDDLSYSRRALRRAGVKMMHSQEYTLLDKVNLFDIWRQEYAIEQPKKSQIASYFEISDTEAQRLKVVAQLDEKVAQEIINSGRRPADEVVYLIANRPPEEHREAYKKLGDLTVSAARKLLKEEDQEKPDAKVSGAGRPRNYFVSVKNEESGIAYISTSLTVREWKRRGGAKAFWNELRRLVNDRDVQVRLQKDLG